jgi:hypothetical protein
MVIKLQIFHSSVHGSSFYFFYEIPGGIVVSVPVHQSEMLGSIPANADCFVFPLTSSFTIFHLPSFLSLPAIVLSSFKFIPCINVSMWVSPFVENIQHSQNFQHLEE